jgi:hypothetical protein
VIWFLCLFPAFRALEAQRDQLVDVVHSLKEELAGARSQTIIAREAWERAEKRADEAIAAERTTYQFHENLRAQERYGGQVMPYPDAPHLPVDTVRPEETGPLEGGFRSGSQAVEEENREFAARYAKLFEENKDLIRK